MRTKVLLIALLLVVGFCLAPVVGHGEVKDWLYCEEKATYMEYRLLNARVDYMMRNPNTFLAVGFEYDPDGSLRREYFPERTGVDTRGKILIGIIDNGDVFSDKSGTALLDQFYRELMIIYSFLTYVSSEMSTDIVAKFWSKDEIPLGYFYQGEYYLWEEKKVIPVNKQTKEVTR